MRRSIPLTRMLLSCVLLDARSSYEIVPPPMTSQFQEVLRWRGKLSCTVFPYVSTFFDMESKIPVSPLRMTVLLRMIPAC
jgi:hypothetical protein